jgi:glycosyltransferase involved in cell wall biosynthesis
MYHKKFKTISILLCTFNGEKFLAKQLNSIKNQSFVNWIIHASDDGSTDKTLSLLNEFKNKLGDKKVKIYNGPQKGFAKNFLSLASNKNIKSDYYCFCDQDDIWLPDKLIRAINELEKFQDEFVPLLYCGRTIYVDNNLKKLNESPLFHSRPEFANSLVQNIAGGNTMVFNNQTKALLEKITVVNTVSHDWLVYQIVTGVGGRVIYDKEPYLLYRQHEIALIGGNRSFYSRLTRINYIFKNVYKNWNKRNIEVLNKNKLYLTKENNKLLQRFKYDRNQNLIKRINLIKCGIIKRQTFLSKTSLYLLAILNKL